MGKRYETVRDALRAPGGTVTVLVRSQDEASALVRYALRRFPGDLERVPGLETSPILRRTADPSRLVAFRAATAARIGPGRPPRPLDAPEPGAEVTRKRP